MPEIIRMVGVYYAGESLRSPAKQFMDRAGSDSMVESGLALYSKSGNCLILNRTRAEIKLRDVSCCMGGEVTELAVMGSVQHQVLVEAWRPMMRAA